MHVDKVEEYSETKRNTQEKKNINQNMKGSTKMREIRDAAKVVFDGICDYYKLSELVNKNEGKNN